MKSECMKPSKILLKAAEQLNRVPANQYAGMCGSLVAVAMSAGISPWSSRAYDSAKLRAVVNLFRPTDAPRLAYWGMRWGGRRRDVEEVKRCRVLALCFAAAIAESEEQE